jgi:hypothetical protein
VRFVGIKGRQQHMHVGIDQTGHHCGSGRVDYPGVLSGWRFASCAGGDDPPVGDLQPRRIRQFAGDRVEQVGLGDQ